VAAARGGNSSCAANSVAFSMLARRSPAARSARVMRAASSAGLGAGCLPANPTSSRSPPSEYQTALSGNTETKVRSTSASVASSDS
jgi:hypothetical protein